MATIKEFTPALAATDARVYRIIPSIFPPVSIFDRVADPKDLEDVFLVESMTNDRLAHEAGDLSLIPPTDRVSGPGTTPIMAAFTHLNPEGARFTDATFGAYYAGLEIETAVAETRHHREVFLARTNEPPIDVDMRVYIARVRANLHDIRGEASEHPDLYHPTDYAAGQTLARSLRADGSDGIIYDSVRNAGGTCMVVFRPRLLSECRQERHLTYRWDGTAIREVYEKRSFP